MDKILEFKGEYRFLSNFYPCKIEYEGIEFKSTEAAYQAAKTLDIEKRKEIAAYTNPADAKKIGKKLKIRPNWENIKLSVMEELLRKKFVIGSDLAKKLINTGDIILEEGNFWKDVWWGICPVGSGIGENNLGKLLMKIRDKLNEKTI